MKKGISVIVCCYNSTKRLQDTLSHLILQKTNGFDWEIIVVDNASTDNTAQLAEKILSCSIEGIKYQIVSESNPGLSYARKKGFHVARYAYLIYCDDDNHLADNYLTETFRILENNPNIGILGGHGSAVFEGKKPEWFDSYKINFAVGEQSDNKTESKLIQADFVYGAGMALRSVILEKMEQLRLESLLSDRKGNELISGGDTELCILTKYLGYEVWYSRTLQFSHLMTMGRMNWKYLKKLYFGFGRMNVYLQAYDHFNRSERLPNFDLRFPFWIDTLLHKIRALFLFLPKVLFHYFEVGNKDVLRFYGMCGEIYEVWYLKNKYAEVFKKILDIKRRVESMSVKLQIE